MVVPIYVDECHITLRRNSIRRFELGDLEPTSWFLGTGIQRNRSIRLITLSQYERTADMHKDFGIEDCSQVIPTIVPVCA